jgi:hypothetical protein
VCRRRLASDLVRASEGTPAQGEDHRDLLSGSPLHRVEHLFSVMDLQALTSFLQGRVGTHPRIGSQTGRTLDV